MSTDDIKRAVITSSIGLSNVEHLADVEVLWLTPASIDFRIEAPLFIPHLRVLYVSECNQPLISMVDAHCFDSIEWLVVAKSPDCFTGIHEAGGFRSLVRFKLREQELSIESEQWLANRDGLESLSLTDTSANNDTISSLGCRSTLRSLDLWRTLVSFEPNTVSSDPFPCVRSLVMSETKITRESITVIERVFPSLERLIATGTCLSRVDISRIAAWERLKVLQTNTPSQDFDEHQDPFWDV